MSDSTQPPGESLSPKPAAPKGVAPAGATAAGAAPGATPLILIPVTAEDVARKARRVKAVWITAVVVVAAVSGWIYKRSTDPVRAQQAYAAALRLFDAARYEQAVVSSDRAIALKPDYADAYLLRGRAHVANYASDLAVADFTRALELRPRDVQALLGRAAAYVDQKNYQAAIADTTSALAADPKQERAYNLRGTALRNAGEAAKSIAEFTKAIELDPNSDNYYQRGATYQLLNDHPHAIQDFSQAISWDDDKPQAYFARAESERALGQTKQADEDHLHGRILDGR